VVVLRELGPLLTAIVVIGRSGSAFAAEIGTKKVTEEVDALRTMAFDPVAFLVAPKFLAMLAMVPALTIWDDLLGIAGGGVFGVIGANFTFHSYFTQSLDAIELQDVYTGLIKSVVFATVITAVGCREGFATGAGAEEVGRSTTSAVVTSIFVVVVVDMVFTSLFYLTSEVSS
jgi:phospholipid/cholesterol/gamma-HCH transport system permease protein